MALGAGGTGQAGGQHLTTGDVGGCRRKDMEAAAGFSEEALLGGGSYVAVAAAVVVVELAAAVAAQTACQGGGLVPEVGRRWTLDQPWRQAGGTAGGRRRRPAGGQCQDRPG